MARLVRMTLPTTLVGLALGTALWFGGARSAAGAAWSATTLFALIPLTLEVTGDLRTGPLGVAIIALLSLASALVFGPPLAGAVPARLAQYLDPRRDGRPGSRPPRKHVPEPSRQHAWRAIASRRCEAAAERRSGRLAPPTCQC